MAAEIQFPGLTRSKTIKSIIHKEQEVEISEGRMSWNDRFSVFSRSILKYGTGRHSQVELCPQPSNDASDPLNWALWKKDLSFFSLCFTVATVGALKSILFTVNSVIQTEFNVSYLSAAALTGAPLLFAAISGLLSTGLSQIFGKRSIYLSSVILMFGGSMWNMHITDSYTQFMVARTFQGIGWGAFEALALSSINDMYFAHQKRVKTTIYTFISLASTWGPPILGGYISQSVEGWRQQFMLLSIFQSVSIVLVIFGNPETAFSPSVISADPSFKYGKSSTIITAAPTPHSRVLGYVGTLKPVSYQKPFKVATFFSPLRQTLTPTSALLSLHSVIPSALIFSIASSLSCLFSPMPTFLLPAPLGYLFTMPLLFIVIFHPVATFLLPTITSRMTIGLARSSKTKSRRNLWLLVPAMVFGLAGTLGFGIYLGKQSIPEKAIVLGASFRHRGDSGINVVVVSMFLGLMVAGTVLGDVATWGYLSGDMAAKRKSDGPRQRRAGDDDDVLTWNAVSFWKNVVTGIMVITLPAGIVSAKLLQMTFIGLSVLELVMYAGVSLAMFWALKLVKRGDRFVLARSQEAGLRRWESNASFFDV